MSDNGKQYLEQIQAWFNSGEAAYLVAAYAPYHVDGTTGTMGHMRPKPAILNDHGVLLPKQFERYVVHLQSKVRRALEFPNPQRVLADNDLKFLLSTLEQIITNAQNLPDEEYNRSGKTVQELFNSGKNIATLLRQYFTATDQSVESPFYSPPLGIAR